MTYITDLENPCCLGDFVYYGKLANQLIIGTYTKGGVILDEDGIRVIGVAYKWGILQNELRLGLEDLETLFKYCKKKFDLKITEADE